MHTVVKPLTLLSLILIFPSPTPQDTMEGETGGELAGLPSALLEPQCVVLDQDLHDLEGEGTMNLTALTSHLARTELDHDEFSTSQVRDIYLVVTHRKYVCLCFPVSISTIIKSKFKAVESHRFHHLNLVHSKLNVESIRMW